jgi:CspA family cold shock protein
VVDGTVKWFNAKKGFGFIVADGYDRDIFVHYSIIEGDGFRSLTQGEAVRLEVHDEGKGPRATAVARVEEPAPID